MDAVHTWASQRDQALAIYWEPITQAF